MVDTTAGTTKVGTATQSPLGSWDRRGAEALDHTVRGESAGAITAGCTEAAAECPSLGASTAEPLDRPGGGGGDGVVGGAPSAGGMEWSGPGAGPGVAPASSELTVCVKIICRGLLSANELERRRRGPAPSATAGGGAAPPPLPSLGAVGDLFAACFAILSGDPKNELDRGRRTSRSWATWVENLYRST